MFLVYVFNGPKCFIRAICLCLTLVVTPPTCTHTVCSFMLNFQSKSLRNAMKKKWKGKTLAFLNNAKTGLLQWETISQKFLLLRFI